MKNNKKGFTLAEVLTTLGIIGVVAALTTPMIVHRMADAQIPPKLLKFQSTFSRATQRMLVDEGADSILGIDAIGRTNENAPERTEIFGKILSNYMKISDTTEQMYDTFNIDGRIGAIDPRTRQYNTKQRMVCNFVL